jgi:hypothetical protein
MDDLNAALAKGAIDGLKEIAKDVLKAGTAFGRKQIGKLAVDFEFGFKEYLDRNYRRLSIVKTLLNPATPVSLEATYVAPSLAIGEKRLTEDQFISRIKKDKFFVITGMGGSGKSIFLKHLFVRHYNEALGRVPIFVELRNVKPETKLIAHMANYIAAVAPAIDSELFEYALKAGKFLLLLDGFDEIDSSMRDTLAKQIVELSYEFGENGIILTSRPDGPFGSWSEFHVAKMEAFNKKQVTSLVSKMDYELSVKREFLQLIKNGLYDSHRNYLSNPLLCTLMLLTFDQGAEIPSKMHVFFERAFEVLFYKHDATKETSFRRKFETSLDIDGFRQTFAAFSTFCYLDNGSSFTHSQAIRSARQALEYNEFQENADAFISDLCTSVSILVREGENYNYIHRSLQEFFVAQFLAYREIDDWDAVVQQITTERPNDSVVDLLADINRDRFERKFLAPRIREFRNDLEAIDIAKNPVTAFKLFYITFSFHERAIASWTVGEVNFRPKWHYLLRFVERDSSFAGRHKMLNSFNWGDHFSKVHAEVTEDEVGHELVEVSDRSLSATPMVEYLQALKFAAIAIDSRLQATAANQQRLVSSALLKK